jgi:hypothetical protein
MATVRFSKELKEAILKNAKGVFSKRIEEAQQSAPKDWGDKIYDIIFAQYIPTLNSLPIEYFSTSDTLKFAGFVNANEFGSVSFDMKLSTKRPFPAELPPSLKDVARKTGYYNHEYKLYDRPEFDEFKQLVMDWRRRVINIQSQREQFINSVDQVINAHATLAPALKMWQPLWDLVPEQYKDRHREVRERTERETSTVNVDLAKMTAIATAAKIGGL